jgi:cyclophilin family peptidyl-prolyl cis-trans isomerase/protein-disulfide isomerase
MRKMYWFGLVMCLLLMTGCASATPTAEPTAIPTPQPTEAAVLPTETILPTDVPAAVADCVTYNLMDDILAPASLGFSPVNADTDHVTGPQDAKLTIVEYSDFQCPACQSTAPVIKQFLAAYGDQVRFVYRHFPLSFHEKASPAAAAAEAAGLQDKFFEMEEVLYASPDEWNEMTLEDFDAYLLEKAEEIGLDMDQFQQDWKSDAVLAAVQEDYNSGLSAGVNATPSIFINGRLYSGQRSVDVFAALLDLIDLGERQYKECPAMEIDQSKTYTATLKTDKGDIVIELYDDIAPITVNSFVFLAREGWYDNIIFHRVISGFVAQTGDPLGMGYGGPGYTFRNETDPDYTFDSAGVVGMANSGADMNGSQFFITYTELHDLDGAYTVFGRVIEGMDVVESLTPRDPTTAAAADLPQGSLIESVEITEE